MTKSTGVVDAVLGAHGGVTVGIGSGPGVEAFVEALAERRGRVEALVAASPSAADRAASLGLPVTELNAIGSVAVFVTEARAFTPHLTHLTAPGPAMAAERVLAAAARHYVLLADPAREARVLGDAPVPLEVLPFARAFVVREVRRLGGLARRVPDLVSESGNDLMEAERLDLTDPYRLERQLDGIPGLVAHGLHARRRADRVLDAAGAVLRERPAA